jgi:hypothetical protein
MRKCDLITGVSRICDALEKLQIVWQESSNHWNDSVSRRFLEEHLDPMVPEIKLATESVGRMNSLIEEVQRDCDS